VSAWKPLEKDPEARVDALSLVDAGVRMGLGKACVYTLGKHGSLEYRNSPFYANYSWEIPSISLDARQSLGQVAG
jgi:hypothetical protein